MITGVEHVVRVVVSRPDTPLYRAICMCGWKSKLLCSRSKAETHAARHRESAR